MPAPSPAETAMAGAFSQMTGFDSKGLDVMQKPDTGIVSFDYTQLSDGRAARNTREGQGIRVVVDTRAIAAGKPLKEAVGIARYTVGVAEGNPGTIPHAVATVSAVDGNSDLVAGVRQNQGAIIVPDDVKKNPLSPKDMPFVTAAVNAIKSTAAKPKLSLD